MKRNRYILYAVLIAGAVLLVAGAALVWAPRGLNRVEQPEPADPYDAIEYNIERAQDIASELQDFNWDEFADIGLEAPPSEVCKLGDRVTEKGSFDASSGCQWLPLPEMLPRPESAGPMVLYCDTCSQMAEHVRLERPSDNSITPQWLELCSQLYSTLKGAEQLATNYKNTNEYVLTNIGNSINDSDPAIKQRYQEKFTNRSAQYLSLLDDFTYSLQQAEEAVTLITDGQVGDTPPILQEQEEREIH